MLQLAAARPQELVGKVIGRGVFNRFPSFILCLFNLCEGEQRCLGSASTGPTKAQSTSLTTTTRMTRGFLRKYGRHSEWLLGRQFSQDFISSLTKIHYLHIYIFLYNHPRGVSVFPVGLVLKYGVSSPILRDGRVTGFYDAFQAGRKVTDFSAIFLTIVQFYCVRVVQRSTHICKISYTLK